MDEVGLFLSLNKSEHVYCQTPKEGLMHLFHMMKTVGESYQDVEPKKELLVPHGSGQNY